MGSYITPKAKEYIKNHSYETDYQKNRYKKEVEISHKIISYEDFLQDPVFNINNQIDPNTSQGFYHNLLNCLEFDKDLKYKYLKSTNYKKALPDKLNF